MANKKTVKPIESPMPVEHKCPVCGQPLYSGHPFMTIDEKKQAKAVEKAYRQKRARKEG